MWTVASGCTQAGRSSDFVPGHSSVMCTPIPRREEPRTCLLHGGLLPGDTVTTPSLCKEMGSMTKSFTLRSTVLRRKETGSNPVCGLPQAEIKTRRLHVLFRDRE